MDKAHLDELLSRVKEIDELLRFPGVTGHIARANALALSIARDASSGAIVNLAMQVISEANSLPPPPLPLRPDDSRLRDLLRRLRAALAAAESAKELVRKPG